MVEKQECDWFRSWLAKGIFLDIEAVPGGKLLALGAVYGDQHLLAESSKELKRAESVLRSWVQEASFVAGHNVLWHDLPILEAAGLGGLFEGLPVVDTLALSPLAFPKNPYHRLIKNDLLVSLSKKNPVGDARNSRQVLSDALDALSPGNKAEAERNRYIGYAVSGEALPRGGSMGIAQVFQVLDADGPEEAEAASFLERLPGGRCCSTALTDLQKAAAADPAVRLASAYLVAWLEVAGTDSVLPEWVWRRFPETGPWLRRLRTTPCEDPECRYCGETHDPQGQLQRFFGYPDFRAEPGVAGSPGKSLQGELVRLGMGDVPLLGILPTGGGKSLCYQVPALHRQYCDGSLTVVISPLQALMKDQVDGMVEKTGLHSAGALYGMLTPPERGMALEDVRLGTTGILYVSPEQLRNRTFRENIRHRQIRGWVFDEAHCLSKWGHDFRPDYLYAGRFIRELAREQGTPIPPVFCFTATAKEDVKREILEYFETELGIRLQVLDGGTERENLNYVVEKTASAGHWERIHELLEERLSAPGLLVEGEGGGVVFTATRKEAEHVASYLKEKGWLAAHFHSAIPTEEKKSVLDAFMAGTLQVVAATNAFGMGVDKADIRVVIHAQVPGSLENYLQEAGRAGRDHLPSECILLFNEEDLEKQFGITAYSSITQKDISRILGAIRKMDRNEDHTLTISAGEILDKVEGGRGAVFYEHNLDELKVRTAIAILERQGFVERNENRNRVFQARALVENWEEAARIIDGLNLGEQQQRLWSAVMRAFLELPSGECSNIDVFANLPEMVDFYRQERERVGAEIGIYTPVFRILNEMAKHGVGLIRKDLMYSAFVHLGNRNSRVRLKGLLKLELAFWKLMEEADPDDEGIKHLSLRRANQHLLDDGIDSSVPAIERILKTWEKDHRRIPGCPALAEVRFRKHGLYGLRLYEPRERLKDAMETRHALSAMIVGLLIKKARRLQRKAGETGGLEGPALIEFSESELLGLMAEDLSLQGILQGEPQGAIDATLVYLHEHQVLGLQGGKALVTQAMSLHVLEPFKKQKTRRFTKGDYEGLRVHYEEKRFQVHVMREYAKFGMDKMRAHLRLVLDYFKLGKDAFARKYFEGRTALFQLATSIESYRKIVNALGHPVQEAIVASPPDKNQLILAGPGSGKTRVVAHRCAYLLRVERIPANRILVVCFNRSAALELRRRIYSLVKSDAHGVTILTYHALALKILGRSLARESGPSRKADPDFSSLIPEAVQVLRGTQEVAGIEPDEARDQLLGGISHILVDEYQDIDQNEYDLVSEIAGRTRKDSEDRLSILAVGDDDQNIYAFKGANVEFIRKFKEDYGAEEHFLIENYRSTAHIIDAANTLISQNRDRIKTQHPIRVNARRKSDAAGGRWDELDPVAGGRIRLMQAADAAEQAAAVAAEILRMNQLDGGSAAWNQYAIFARTREDLVWIRAVLEDCRIPVAWRGGEEDRVPLFRLREVEQFRRWLEEESPADVNAPELREVLAELRGGRPYHRWWQLLDEILKDFHGEVGEGLVPSRVALEFLLEALSQLQHEPAPGIGVTLSTAHRAKGLEFAHVFLADGGWDSRGGARPSEEERRVYYVGMTRAKETLTLCKRKDRQNPFAEEAAFESIRLRPETPRGINLDSYRGQPPYFDTLGPADLDLSFAGRCVPEHGIHRQLENLEVGAPLFPELKSKSIYLKDQTGWRVGRLSKRAYTRWKDKIDTIQEVLLIGCLERNREESDPEYSSKLLTDRWLVPLAEIKAGRVQGEKVSQTTLI